MPPPMTSARSAIRGTEPAAKPTGFMDVLFPVRSIQIAVPPVCQNCGYSLRGLRELICPECGSVYAPPAPSRPRPAFTSRVFRPQFVCTLVSIILLALEVVLVLTIPGGSNTSKREPWYAWGHAAFAAALASLFIAIFAPNVGPPELIARGKRETAIGLSLFAALGGFMLLG